MPTKKTAAAHWLEGPTGRYTNKKGYTLTRVGKTRGWRLCDAAGELLVTQLELLNGMELVFEWADQYIRYLEAPAKKQS